VRDRPEPIITDDQRRRHWQLSVRWPETTPASWVRVAGTGNPKPSEMASGDLLITIRRSAKPIKRHPQGRPQVIPAATISTSKKATPIARVRQAQLGWKREHPGTTPRAQSARRKNSQGEAFSHHLAQWHSAISTRRAAAAVRKCVF